VLQLGQPARPSALRTRALSFAWLGIAVALVFFVMPAARPSVRVLVRVVAVPAAVAPAAAAPAAAAPAAGVPAAAAGARAVAPPAAAAPVSAKGGPVTITLTEGDLTAAAARAFPQTIAGMTLSDPVVHLVPGSAQMTATTKLLFATTQFAASGTPAVAGGKVVVRLDSATLAGIGVPDAARGSIIAAVESAIARALPPKLQVTAVTVGAGTVTFQGTPQP
jgi:hypothetical protein